jgi:hypothetical protein
MEDASEWVVSRVSDATDVVQHSLIVVVGLTFTADLRLFVEYHGLDAFFLQLSCSGQASWASADDAYWRLFVAAVRPGRGCQGEGEQRKGERPRGSALHDGKKSIEGRERVAEHEQVIGTARDATTLPLPRKGPRAARCVGSLTRQTVLQSQRSEEEPGCVPRETHGTERGRASRTCAYTMTSGALEAGRAGLYAECSWVVEETVVTARARFPYSRSTSYTRRRCSSKGRQSPAAWEQRRRYTARRPLSPALSRQTAVCRCQAMLIALHCIACAGQLAVGARVGGWRWAFSLKPRPQLV